MNRPLVVTEQNELTELREQRHFPAAARIISTVISYIFHPLFIPVYLSWFIVRIQPYLFASFSETEKMITILRFGVMYVMFPLVTVLLLKALGFVKSIQLRTQKDRIIPYIACGLYYFWMWYVLRNQPEFPRASVALTFAIFLASSAGLIANVYMKVSMHALAMGVMTTFICLLAFEQTINFGFYITVAFIIAGIVCTARFIVSDHTGKEIYVGLLIGMLSQVFAWLY